MKNLFSFCFVVLLLMTLSLGCKNNPFSASLYTCTIPGKPIPKTSDDYYERALDHIEIASKGTSTNIDDCAIQALNETIRLDPNNANAYRVRGNGYRQEKKYELALADFDKAIQLDPNTESNLYSRKYLYESLEKFDKAIEDQTTILNLHLRTNPPENEKLIKDYEERAELYEKSGSYENALKDYSELFRLEPNSVLYLIRRAKTYERKVDLQNAAKDYSEIIRIQPNEANHYYLRSDIYRKLGKNDLAELDEKKWQELLAEKEGKTPNETKKNSDESKLISGLVFNASQLGFPKPVYSPAARAVRARGEVKVQVMIDKTGKIISAKAISGHALLRSAAETAALQINGFQPILIEGKPVIARGVIVYDFTPE